MKTSFHQDAVAFREKSYGKDTALLNSKGYRPVGKRDKAKARAESDKFLDQTLTKPENPPSPGPASADTKDNKETAGAAGGKTTTKAINSRMKTGRIEKAGKGK